MDLLINGRGSNDVMYVALCVCVFFVKDTRVSSIVFQL